MSILCIRKRGCLFPRKSVTCLAVVSLFIQSLFPFTASAKIFSLPQPGHTISLSPAFHPQVLKGIKINPHNPLQFDLVVDTGDASADVSSQQAQTTKLIRYFLTALTIADDDLWVNLSPYEKDRIIPSNLARTELGYELLTQDYVLKQLTASLSDPKTELGRQFWSKVKQQAQQRFSTAEIPLNALNKVWIVPNKVVVYEQGNSAFIVDASLKVLMDKDYAALQHHSNETAASDGAVQDFTSDITREVILPAIEKEVNEGELFASLRQVYHSLILATWFKRNMRKTVLGQVYVDQNKMNGVDVGDEQDRERIYSQYLNLFRQGAYSFIQEEWDPQKEETIPRKYFSGGTRLKINPDNYIVAGSAISFKIAGTGVTETVSLVPHRAVNDYIKAHSPKDLLADPDEIENYDQGWAAVIPIPELFEHTGQFGHIGLGTIYGRAVVYVDEEYQHDDTLLAHERYEVQKWEEERQRLGLEPEEMRPWIKSHYAEALTLATQWHQEAPSIARLYENQTTPARVVEDPADVYEESDINLAAGEGVLRKKDQLRQKLTEMPGGDYTVFQVVQYLEILRRQYLGLKIDEMIEAENQERVTQQRTPINVIKRDYGEDNKGRIINFIASHEGEFTTEQIYLGAEVWVTFDLPLPELVDFVAMSNEDRQRQPGGLGPLHLRLSWREQVRIFVEKWDKEQLTTEDIPENLRSQDGVDMMPVINSIVKYENEKRQKANPGAQLIKFDYIPRRLDPKFIQEVLKNELKDRTGEISDIELAKDTGVSKPSVQKYAPAVIDKINTARRQAAGSTEALLTLMISQNGGRGQRRAYAIGQIKQEINKILTEVFGEFTQSDLLNLFSRYPVDIRGILLGIGVTRVGYDKELVKEVIDTMISEFIDQAIEGTTDEEIAPHVEFGRRNDPIKVLERTELTGERIADLARKIKEQLDKSQAKTEEQAALKEMGTKQARSFLKHLEEKRFFRENSVSLDGSVDQTMKRLEDDFLQQAESEDGQWLGDILGSLHTEFDQAVNLRNRLIANGLKAKTVMEIFHLYQFIGVYRINQLRRAILADEMGTGKTLQAIAAFLLSGLPEMLVSTPHKGLERWLEDLFDHVDAPVELILLGNFDIPAELLSKKPDNITIRTFDTIEQRNRYLYTEREAPPEGTRRIILTNHELLPFLETYRREQSLPACRVDFIAVDEAHELKNAKTGRAEAVFGDKDGNGAIEAEYKLIMTGTPLENRIRDLFGYLQYLARGQTSQEEKFIAGLDLPKFSRRFNAADMSSLAILHGYLANRMIRRLKDDVLRGLPKKEVKIVRLNPEAGTMQMNGDVPIKLSGNYRPQAHLYEETTMDPVGVEERVRSLQASHVISENIDMTDTGVKDEIVDEELQQETSEEESEEEMPVTAPVSQSQQPIKKTPAATQILRMEQAATDPKLFNEDMDNIKFDAAISIIKERLEDRKDTEDGKSILIFSTYRKVTDHFLDRLHQEFGDTVSYVVGGVEGEDMFIKIDKFQRAENKILMGTYGKIGTSINATQAHTVLCLNYPWKPSTLAQAIDRAHRIDPKRNHENKVLEIIFLEFEAQVPIDTLKARVIERKKILGEMIVNGDLAPQILAAFNEIDESVITAKIEDATDGVAPASFDEYEISKLSELRLLLGHIDNTKDPDKLATMWAQASALYTQVLEHKGSYFANLASLDFLAQYLPALLPSSPEEPLKFVDMGSGPSTLEKARRVKEQYLNHMGMFMVVDDYDASEEMMERGESGSDRKGQQLVASFEQAHHIPNDSYNVAYISYAFRYASHPAELMRQIFRFLKDNGRLVIILPKKNFLPPKFYDALARIGFHNDISEGQILESKLNDQTIKILDRDVGPEIRKDYEKVIGGEHTFLVVSKSEVERRGVLPEVTDEELAIGRVKIDLTPEKVERIRNSKARLASVFVPEKVAQEVIGEIAEREDQPSVESATKAGNGEKATRNARLRNIRRMITDDLSTSFQQLIAMAFEVRTKNRRTTLERDILETISELRVELSKFAAANNLNGGAQTLITKWTDFKEMPPKYTRKWNARARSHGEGLTTDDFLRNFELHSKAIDRIMAQIAQKAGGAAGSPLSVDSKEEYGGINFNASGMNIETLGSGIDPVIQDMLEPNNLCPINGFSPLLMETVPFTGLMPLSEKPSEKPSEAHLSAAQF